MNAAERRVFTDLVGALAERFSRTGHVMQQIERENRGHCPPGQCCLRCSTYVALFHDACDILESEQPVQQPLDGAAGTMGRVS